MSAYGRSRTWLVFLRELAPVKLMRNHTPRAAGDRPGRGPRVSRPGRPPRRPGPDASPRAGPRGSGPLSPSLNPLRVGEGELWGGYREGPDRPRGGARK